MTVLCLLLKYLVNYLTREMVFELSLYTMVKFFGLVFWVVPKMGEDIILDISRVRFCGVREQQGLKPMINVTVHTTLNQLTLNDN